MPAASINTVLGPIAPAALGFTLMHEHVMIAASGMYQAYPDLLGKGPEAKVRARRGAIPDDHLEAVRAAVKYCPTQALRLVHDDANPQE